MYLFRNGYPEIVFLYLLYLYTACLSELLLLLLFIRVKNVIRYLASQLWPLISPQKQKVRIF